MVGYVGLGSNVGNREEHLREGLLSMLRRGVRPVAVSSLWETEPVGGAGPGWFLNMVARVETALDPGAVLAALLAVEAERGRVRRYPSAPRELDLDLLLLGELRVDGEALTLPHPRMWARRFVLAPLAELAPDLVDAAGGRTVAEALEALADPHVVRGAGTLALPETLPLYSRAL